MILLYNKSQKEIIDLKFHTYIYSVFKKLGIDINLIGTKYYYSAWSVKQTVKVWIFAFHRKSVIITL